MHTCETCRYAGHQEKGCMAKGGVPRYTNGEGCPMYAMSARAFMDQVRFAQRRITALQERARYYKALAMKTTSSLEAIRTSGTDRRSKVEDGVCALIDIGEEIEKQAQALRTAMTSVCSVISRLDDPSEKEVLELRYLSGYRWEDIARRMMYDERQVRRIHIKALEHVQREMDCIEYAAHRPGWCPGGAAQNMYIQ